MKQKTALITGASKGIGFAVAKRFAPELSDLHLAARGAEGLQEAAEALARPGLTVHLHPVDLAKEEGVHSLAQGVLSATPKLDVLVNNAGIYLPGSLLGDGRSNLRYMIEINLLSHIDLTNALDSAFSSGGYIFEMSSVAAKKMFLGKPGYSISKHAQGAMIEALRHEMRPRGVRVTSVMPGPTWSHSWEGATFPEDRLLDAAHVAESMFAAWQLPHEAVMEELVIRPFEGDIE
jgi:NAD(P)-dependent dehydrogenase (short-subunit alcohol dehydrogenase family)